MIKAIKIRLKPTNEQEILMFKSVGCARFAYNWGLSKWEEIYKYGGKPSKAEIRAEFNNTIKKHSKYVWLKEVSAQVTQHAFEDLNNAYNNFFKGLSKYPKCYFDGKYWYLTLSFEHNENQVELNKDLSVGIDLGVSNLAIVNCLDKPIKNINKSVKVKKLKKKLKRLQREVSRKYEANKKGKEFVKTKNIIKLEKQIKLIHRKLNNIRLNHIHQATNMIVKLNPHRVVMEDLNISGMMKNKHLSESIQEQKFYEFIRQMKYKCEFNGIEFVTADRFYPSSKTCSCCGNIKKDLKLKDRVYVCDKCGFKIDRDKNASINLSNYKIA